MNNLTALFARKALPVAEAIVDNAPEYLSDNEVFLLKSEPVFRALVEEAEQALRRRRGTPPGSGAPAAVSFATPRDEFPSEHLALLLEWTRDRQNAGWTNPKILASAQEWGLAPSVVARALQALENTERGLPPPGGGIEYSKRHGESFLRVNFDRGVDGRESFMEMEPTDVRAYVHRTTHREECAARFLLRANWSSCRIVIDDFMRILAPQAECELLLKLLGDHAGLAGALVRRRDLGADEDDLLQDVALRLLARRRAGGKLSDEAAAPAFVQASLRNRAHSQARDDAAWRKPLNQSEHLLNTLPARVSAEAERAHDVIDSIRPKLSRFGRFALRVWLNEIGFSEYMREVRCSKRTAARHFRKGTNELARLIRADQAREFGEVESERQVVCGKQGHRT